MKFVYARRGSGGPRVELMTDRYLHDRGAGWDRMPWRGGSDMKNRTARKNPWTSRPEVRGLIDAYEHTELEADPYDRYGYQQSTSDQYQGRRDDFYNSERERIDYSYRGRGREDRVHWERRDYDHGRPYWSRGRDAHRDSHDWNRGNYNSNYDRSNSKGRKTHYERQNNSNEHRKRSRSKSSGKDSKRGSSVTQAVPSNKRKQREESDSESQGSPARSWRNERQTTKEVVDQEKEKINNHTSCTPVQTDEKYIDSFKSQSENQSPLDGKSDDEITSISSQEMRTDGTSPFTNCDNVVTVEVASTVGIKNVSDSNVIECKTNAQRSSTPGRNSNEPEVKKDKLKHSEIETVLVGNVENEKSDLDEINKSNSTTRPPLNGLSENDDLYDIVGQIMTGQNYAVKTSNCKLNIRKSKTENENLSERSETKNAKLGKENRTCSKVSEIAMKTKLEQVKIAESETTRKQKTTFDINEQTFTKKDSSHRIDKKIQSNETRDKNEILKNRRDEPENIKKFVPVNFVSSKEETEEKHKSVLMPEKKEHKSVNMKNRRSSDASVKEKFETTDKNIHENKIIHKKEDEDKKTKINSSTKDGKDGNCNDLLEQEKVKYKPANIEKRRSSDRQDKGINNKTETIKNPLLSKPLSMDVCNENSAFDIVGKIICDSDDRKSKKSLVTSTPLKSQDAQKTVHSCTDVTGGNVDKQREMISKGENKRLNSEIKTHNSDCGDNVAEDATEMPSFKKVCLEKSQTVAERKKCFENEALFNKNKKRHSHIKSSSSSSHHHHNRDKIEFIALGPKKEMNEKVKHKVSKNLNIFERFGGDLGQTANKIESDTSAEAELEPSKSDKLKCQEIPVKVMEETKKQDKTDNKQRNKQSNTCLAIEHKRIVDKKERKNLDDKTKEKSVLDTKLQGSNSTDISIQLKPALDPKVPTEENQEIYTKNDVNSNSAIHCSMHAGEEKQRRNVNTESMKPRVRHISERFSKILKTEKDVDINSKSESRHRHSDVKTDLNRSQMHVTEQNEKLFNTVNTEKNIPTSSVDMVEIKLKDNLSSLGVEEDDFEQIQIEPYAMPFMPTKGRDYDPPLSDISDEDQAKSERTSDCQNIVKYVDDKLIIVTTSNSEFENNKRKSSLTDSTDIPVKKAKIDRDHHTPHKRQSFKEGRKLEFDNTESPRKTNFGERLKKAMKGLDEPDSPEVLIANEEKPDSARKNQTDSPKAFLQKAKKKIKVPMAKSNKSKNPEENHAEIRNEMNVEVNIESSLPDPPICQEAQKNRDNGSTNTDIQIDSSLKAQPSSPLQQKGFNIIYKLTLQDSRQVTNTGRLDPQKLQGNCIQCEVCMKNFSPLNFTKHHDSPEIVSQIDYEKASDNKFEPQDQNIIYWNKEAENIWEKFQEIIEKERSNTQTKVLKDASISPVNEDISRNLDEKGEVSETQDDIKIGHRKREKVRARALSGPGVISSPTTVSVVQEKCVKNNEEDLGSNINRSSSEESEVSNTNMNKTALVLKLDTDNDNIKPEIPSSFFDQHSSALDASLFSENELLTELQKKFGCHHEDLDYGNMQLGLKLQLRSAKRMWQKRSQAAATIKDKDKLMKEMIVLEKQKRLIDENIVRGKEIEALARK